MTANTPLDTYFEAFNESYDTIMEATKAGAGRGYRLSSTFLAEAQRGQHEMIEIGRTFVAQPTNLRGIYGLVREVGERRRSRAREIRHQVMDELAQSRREAIETFERMATQQRIAGDATVQLVRGGLNNIIDRAQARLHGVGSAEGAREGADRSEQGADMRKSKSTEPDGVGSDGASAPTWLTSSAESTDVSDKAQLPGSARRAGRPDAVSAAVPGDAGGSALA